MRENEKPIKVKEIKEAINTNQCYAWMLKLIHSRKNTNKKRWKVIRQILTQLAYLFFFLFNLWMRFAKCKGHHSNDILLATHKNQWWWPNAMLIGFLNANERIDILETKLKGLELNCPRKEYGIQKFCISYRCRATIGLQQNEKFKFEL